MPYLVAAVVVLGVLCGLNLMLLLAVVRRLKEHARVLADRPGAGGARLPEAGSAVGHFDALSTDGEAVSRRALEPGTLVGFFSPGCGPCTENLPKFTAYAAALPGGRDRVLAVIAGADDSEEMRVALARVSRVVVEAHGGPVAAAFGVSAFPTFCVLDGEGVITAAGFDLSALPKPITA
ncbi:TlpA disulfide reductase family protein [Streptosporangium sp. NPDC049644]|uniref:TlpA disulfide reductase family protein n=1 Tax=Streptosporangium sp. NPDC049644 TaxID=3155507 RepID=UPI003429A296